MAKYDELVKRVEVFERLAVYGDRRTFLQRLAQMSKEPNQSKMPPAEPNASVDPNPPAPSGVMNMPEDHITGLRPIDPKVQSMLNDILVPSGDILPLDRDGRLGKNTKDALNKFKAKYGPATVANITKVHSQKDSPSAVAKKDPGAPLPPMGQGLSGIGNTKATPSTDTASKIPVPTGPGPKV